MRKPMQDQEEAEAGTGKRGQRTSKEPQVNVRIEVKLLVSSSSLNSISCDGGQEYLRKRR